MAREPRIRVASIGKAAAGMALAAQQALGRSLVGGVVTMSDPPEALTGWRDFSAGHPRPTADSEAAGRAVLALADASRQDDGLLLVCLSGGASAMCAVPAEGLTLTEKAETTTHLLRAGLDISQVNLVRRHLSAIKGGQLAARAGRTVTLAISDVCTPVDDDPMVIGSGPTVGDRTTFADAIALLDRHGLRRDLPRAVVAHLDRGAAGQVAGPVPPDDPRLRQSAYWIVASRHDAMRAAADAASRLGYHVTLRADAVTGEARSAAAVLIDAARDLRRPACLLSSGETVVTVTGDGIGGRNQELASAAVESLAMLVPAALGSIGTDGIDGPTDAAGAFVESSMWGEMGPGARTRMRDALDRNDTYPLLDSLGALVRTGPTGTNVGDLQIVLVG